MIPLPRSAAPASTLALLQRWTDRVEAAGATSTSARDCWGRAAAPKRHVRALLEPMAHGVRRCMYCDDSLGTDIDHFEPIAHAPLRAFVWANHLLACSHCNSNEKREQYPLTADGTCLLIDPTAEDPADHLVLLLRSGVYDHRTDKGEATIEVFGLNRPDLIVGRKDAFFTARAIFRDWYDLHKDGHPDADTTAQALLNSPSSTSCTP